MKLDSIDLAAIAKDFGTPFYLYDLDQTLTHLRRLKAGLPEGVDVFFAMKANANPDVLRAFLGQVAGLDVSSAGEIEMAVAAGHDPAAMSFAGPGKTEHDLRIAIDRQVRLLSIESPTELRRASKVAAELGKTATIALRINPQFTPKEFTMKMGGTPSQFGTAEEDAPPLFEEAKKTKGVRLDGIHIFSGTQCLEISGIVENIRQTLSIASRLSEQHDLRPSHVNLGGGFGVPYFAGQEEIDVDTLASEVGQALRQARADYPRLKDTRFILELGRFLIGTFGIYVSRVVDVKQTRGKRFVVLDGGMHHCFPATGFFGQLVKKNYPVVNLSRAEAEPLAQELVGPLCTPMDSMARNITLPRLEIDDLVGILSAGAYCYSASPLLFLGHETPAEIVLFDGLCKVSRARKAAADIV
jgi:diaminopimelate decarboxylase